MDRELPRITYSPESQLRNPRQLFLSMWHDLLTSRELAWRLFVRNMSAMYRQTILGYVWAFLPPLFTTMTFVFLNSQKIIPVGKTDIPYPAYVMISTLLWQVFVDSLNSPLRIINQSKSFIAKINFPKEALILAGIGEVVFNFLIRLSLLIGVFFLYHISLPATIILTPLGILSLIALGVMFGVLLAPLGVLYQDVEKGLPMFTAIWMFLTPVIYPAPTSWPASLLCKLNPVSPLLITTREMLITGSFSYISSFWMVVILSMSFILLGWLVYRLALPYLIERISA